MNKTKKYVQEWLEISLNWIGKVQGWYEKNFWLYEWKHCKINRNSEYLWISNFFWLKWIILSVSENVILNNK